HLRLLGWISSLLFRQFPLRCGHDRSLGSLVSWFYTCPNGAYTCHLAPARTAIWICRCGHCRFSAYGSTELDGKIPAVRFSALHAVLPLAGWSRCRLLLRANRFFRRDAAFWRVSTSTRCFGVA